MERLRKIISNLGPSAIVTNAELAAKLGDLDTGGAPVLLLEELEREPEDAAAVDAAVADVTDSEPVYVMYTSGSTGEPKGVTIPHRGVLLFARWAEETFGWGPETVIANQAPLYFDVSVMDVYGAMRCGGKLILTPEVLFRFPVKLPEFLRENGVTSIYWVPTVMINIANSGVLESVELPELRSVAFAGEGNAKFAVEHMAARAAGEHLSQTSTARRRRTSARPTLWTGSFRTRSHCP